MKYILLTIILLLGLNLKSQTVISNTEYTYTQSGSFDNVTWNNSIIKIAPNVTVTFSNLKINGGRIILQSNSNATINVYNYKTSDNKNSVYEIDASFLVEQGSSLIFKQTNPNIASFITFYNTFNVQGTLNMNGNELLLKNKPFVTAPKTDTIGGTVKTLASISIVQYDCIIMQPCSFIQTYGLQILDKYPGLYPFSGSGLIYITSPGYYTISKDPNFSQYPMGLTKSNQILFNRMYVCPNPNGPSQCSGIGNATPSSLTAPPCN